MKKLCHIILSTLIFYQVPGYAGTAVPCPAAAVKYEGKAVILPRSETKNNAGYFFKNISSSPIIIDHFTPSKGVSAGLSSTLNPGHWSALQINQKNYPLSCRKNNYTTILDCKKVLFVCAPPNLQLKSQDQGVFWLAEDKDLGSFLKDLSKRGVKY